MEQKTVLISIDGSAKSKMSRYKKTSQKPVVIKWQDPFVAIQSVRLILRRKYAGMWKKFSQLMSEFFMQNIYA